MDEGTRLMNDILDSVYQWDSTNMLTLNAGKSQVIIIYSRPIDTSNLSPVILEGLRIDFVDKVDNLRIIIDKYFSWQN